MQSFDMVLDRIPGLDMPSLDQACVKNISRSTKSYSVRDKSTVSKIKKKRLFRIFISFEYWLNIKVVWYPIMDQKVCLIFAKKKTQLCAIALINRK